MIRFEWDELKSASNLRKHGIGFEAASFALEDPWCRIYKLQVRRGEQRFVSVGAIEDVRLVVVHTTSDDDSTGETVHRLISAREADKREAKFYDKARAQEGWHPDE